MMCIKNIYIFRANELLYTLYKYIYLFMYVLYVYIIYYICIIELIIFMHVFIQTLSRLNRQIFLIVNELL